MEYKDYVMLLISLEFPYLDEDKVEDVCALYINDEKTQNILNDKFYEYIEQTK